MSIVFLKKVGEFIKKESGKPHKIRLRDSESILVLKGVADMFAYCGRYSMSYLCLNQLVITITERIVSRGVSQSKYCLQ